MAAKTITCRELMINYFKPAPGMVTAEVLKTHNSFKSFAVSTIKNNLSVLKQEGYLVIGFRTKGMWEKYKKPAGVRIGCGNFFPGKCYYKLKE